MTIAEKLRLLAEFAETGEEFKIGRIKYMFADDALKIEARQGYIPSDLRINTLVNSEISRLPFKPKTNESYYFIDATTIMGYSVYKNEDVELDKAILSRLEVYRTEKEVKEVIRKLGWKVD